MLYIYAMDNALKMEYDIAMILQTQLDRVDHGIVGGVVG